MAGRERRTATASGQSTCSRPLSSGRLDLDELDARVGQALASRTYAELATVTADLPGGLPVTAPPRKPPRWLVNSAGRWGASGIVAPALLAAAFAVASLAGDGYGAVAFLVTSVYFLCWLSTGADMLWQWHSASLPAAERASGADTLAPLTGRQNPARSGSAR